MRTRIGSGFCVWAVALVTSCTLARAESPVVPTVIVASPSKAFAERLAAKEVRRYVYLRSTRLLPIVEDLPAKTTEPVIVVGRKDSPAVKSLLTEASLRTAVESLAAEQYLLRTFEHNGRPVVLVAGGDAVGTLYGAYRLAERLGVRFYLEGDVAPDAPIALAIGPLNETGKPLFDCRGTLPFSNFPEGSDWWNEDGYKAMLEQLAKLRMNYFNLHTHTMAYTSAGGNMGPEPLVWVGTAADVDADCRVKFSYPSRLFTTLLHTRNYMPTKTGDYLFGAAAMYDRDDYGPDSMRGKAPIPKTTEDCAELFRFTGKLLRDSFTFAHRLGIKTCVSTQGPLSIPPLVQERLRAAGKNPADPAVVQEVYEGMFQRIMKTYPIDYYSLWTTEDWTWYGAPEKDVQAVVTDFRAAVAAAEKVKAPFTLLTSGCTMGPPHQPDLFDRVMPKQSPITGLVRDGGYAFVDSTFGRIKGRPKWVVSWFEDDMAMTSPQLWVGRMRKDAADALAYGCTGLIGLHWRTRVLDPNVSALAAAAWDQSGWNPAMNPQLRAAEARRPEGPDGGQQLRFINQQFVERAEEPIYQTIRTGAGLYPLNAYYLDVPNGVYKVTLKFSELQHSEAGRRVFDVKIQGKTVLDGLDLFAKGGQNRPIDFSFEGVQVGDGRMVIGFQQRVGFPCISGIVLEGPVTRKINCGGDAWGEFQADWPVLPRLPIPFGRFLSTKDFYADWARTQFGDEVVDAAAAVFEKIDGRLPRPTDWVDGPGRIRPDPRPWEDVAMEYVFIHGLARLEPQVRGAGNRERFRYWLDTFEYLRLNGQVNCTWARYNKAMETVKAEQDPAAQKRLARQLALPVRKELVAQTAELMRHLLSTVTTTGEMGTVTNWQNTILRHLLLEPGQELAKVLGEELPADALPSKEPSCPPRLILPRLRSCLTAGEPLRVTAMVLGVKPTDGVVYWSPLGAGQWHKVPLDHVARGVFYVELPPEATRSDLEYYVRVNTDGGMLTLPATAPSLNQSVLVVEGE